MNEPHIDDLLYDLLELIRTNGKLAHDLETHRDDVALSEGPRSIPARARSTRKERDAKVHLERAVRELQAAERQLVNAHGVLDR